MWNLPAVLVLVYFLHGRIVDIETVPMPDGWTCLQMRDSLDPSPYRIAYCASQVQKT